MRCSLICWTAARSDCAGLAELRRAHCSATVDGDHRSAPSHSGEIRWVQQLADVSAKLRVDGVPALEVQGEAGAAVHRLAVEGDLHDGDAVLALGKSHVASLAQNGVPTR